MSIMAAGGATGWTVSDSVPVSGQAVALGAARARRRIELARAEAERMRERVVHLAREDKEFLTPILDGSLSIAQVARLSGQPGWRLRRRLRRLLARLRSPRFRFVAREMELWPPARREVARAVVLEGRTQREAALRLGVSRHHIRRHLEAVRILVDQARAMGRLER